MDDTKHPARTPALAPIDSTGAGLAREVDMETRSFLDRRPAIAHFAVLATFLVPFTLAPYLLMRQRVRGLHKRLDDLAATTSSLQKNMDKAVVARNLIKVELGRNAAQMEIYQKESKHLHRELERLRTEQTASKAVLQSNLQKLLEERKATSTSLRNYFAVLPQLGLSLADIAAFIHEVELYQGLPSTPVNDHGVERLRMLALKLQKSSRPGSSDDSAP